jgi:hypothetical protein
VLGSIWAGSISQWNHPAIQALNPDIASKLPAAAILLGFDDTPSPVAFTEVFRLTLESFSAEFATVFAAANRTFANMPPAVGGTADEVGNTSSARTVWLQVNEEQIYTSSLPRWERES